MSGMSSFIVVTEMPMNREVILNKNYIVFAGKSQGGNDTYIRYNAETNGNPKAGSHLFVKESVEELKKALMR